MLQCRQLNDARTWYGTLLDYPLFWEAAFVSLLASGGHDMSAVLSGTSLSSLKLGPASSCIPGFSDWKQMQVELDSASKLPGSPLVPPCDHTPLVPLPSVLHGLCYTLTLALVCLFQYSEGLSVTEKLRIILHFQLPLHPPLWLLISTYNYTLYNPYIIHHSPPSTLSQTISELSIR